LWGKKLDPGDGFRHEKQVKYHVILFFDYVANMPPAADPGFFKEGC